MADGKSIKLQATEPEDESAENPSPRPVSEVDRSSGQPITGSGRSLHGVRCRKGKWVSEIREPRKTTRIWLGTYQTREMAAAAYDVAAMTLKGADAVLNFPDMASSYEVPSSTTAIDIRAAAAKAASMFKPEAASGSGSGSGLGSVLPVHETVGSGQSSAKFRNEILNPVFGVSKDLRSVSGSSSSGNDDKRFRSTPPGTDGLVQSGLNPVSTKNDALAVPDNVGPSGVCMEHGGAEFVDEEAMLNMPNLLADMAEGMLMTPPRMSSPDEDDSPEEGRGASLWSHH